MDFGDLFVGIGIALVIEGFVYATFPDRAKMMMAQFLQAPSSNLRTGGLVVCGLGVLIVWLVRG